MIEITEDKNNHTSTSFSWDIFMLCGDPRRLATPISPPAIKAKSALLERIGIRREKKDVKFILANGQEVTRSVGFAIIRLDKYFTINEVVFAEPGDLALLGARMLEGLNLTVEPVRACGLGTSTRCGANTIKAIFALAKNQTPLAPPSLIDVPQQVTLSTTRRR